jgi:hypothetical protein
MRRPQPHRSGLGAVAPRAGHSSRGEPALQRPRARRLAARPSAPHFVVQKNRSPRGPLSPPAKQPFAPSPGPACSLAWPATAPLQSVPRILFISPQPLVPRLATNPTRSADRRQWPLPRLRFTRKIAPLLFTRHIFPRHSAPAKCNLCRGAKCNPCLGAIPESRPYHFRRPLALSPEAFLRPAKFPSAGTRHRLRS